MLKSISSRSLSQFHSGLGMSVSTPTYFTSRRFISAWVNLAMADPGIPLSSLQNIDVEKKFTDDKVQIMLCKLSGIKLPNKSLRAEILQSYEQKETLYMQMKRYSREAYRFKLPAPLREPISKMCETPSIFDICQHHTNAGRVCNSSGMFEDPWLQEALDHGNHEYVMGTAGVFLGHGTPEFVKLYRTIFDRTVDTGRFDALHSSRFFGSLAYYLAINGNIAPMLNWFGGRGQLSEAARLILLQKALHPEWKVDVFEEDSDRKIVVGFVRQNKRLEQKMPQLIHFLLTETRHRI